MKDIVICRTESQLRSYLRRRGYRPYTCDDHDGAIVHEGEKVYWVTSWTTWNYDEFVTDSEHTLVCLYRPRNNPHKLDAAAS